MKYQLRTSPASVAHHVTGSYTGLVWTKSLSKRWSGRPARLSISLWAAAILATQGQHVHAQDAQDLAKQLSNPIASLISVPFQWNADFGLGEDDRGERYTLNIQPVIPISVGANLNMISRTIVPVIYQDEVVPGSDQFGLGDVVQSLFFSPKAVGPSGVIWGVGPVLLVPTATHSALGADKWGVGPTAVALKQSGQSTIGVLANHIWSFAGNDQRSNVSQTFIQPFFSYTTKAATSFGVNAEASYNWITDDLTLPVNLTVNQLTKLGKQPIQVGAGFRYYVVRPDGGANWGLRAQITFLFPKSQ